MSELQYEDPNNQERATEVEVKFKEYLEFADDYKSSEETKMRTGRRDDNNNHFVLIEIAEQDILQIQTINLV